MADHDDTAALLGWARNRARHTPPDEPELPSKLSALCDTIERMQSTRDGKARDAAQVLVEALGSVGPEDAPDAARRAVDTIKRLTAERDRYREALRAIAGCDSLVAGDVVDVARRALSPENT